MKGTVFCWDRPSSFLKELLPGPLSPGHHERHAPFTVVKQAINAPSKYTPPKFNMEPKNEGLEDVFPFQMGDC